MGGENVVFSNELLSMYYDRFFPYEEFAMWLAYDKGEELLGLREFSFTLENDQYIRYKSFRNAQEMKSSMMKKMPHKIDIGAVFSVSPEDKTKVPDSAFVPTQRELVFDIDLTDYDDVRTCCQEASICSKCWKFMIAAVKVMDVALRDDFGFKHLLWVYSGRRGIHCWVADETARMLRNEARSAVVQYFTAVEGNENNKRKVVLRDPIHPSLERALSLLEPIFEQHIIDAEGQAIFSDPKSWSKLLDMIPDDDIRGSLHENWTKMTARSPAKMWTDVKNAVQNAISKRKGDIRKLKTCIAEILFAYTYPRLDANVSKQRNHLLKSPFAVHPKTGRVCVPIDPSRIEEFDPFKVPTLGDLERELNDADESQTTFSTYVKYFETRFLKPLQKDQLAERREQNEQNASNTGEW